MSNRFARKASGPMGSSIDTTSTCRTCNTRRCMKVHWECCMPGPSVANSLSSMPATQASITPQVVRRSYYVAQLRYDDDVTTCPWFQINNNGGKERQPSVLN